MTLLTFRQKTYEVIFGTETPWGKRFDEILLFAILLSVIAVILDSVEVMSISYGKYFLWAEWFFTGLFTIEYFVRVYCSPKPVAYMRSPFGIIDLLSIAPTYLSLFFPGTSYLLIIRLLRVLRVFRVLKLARFLTEQNILMRSILLARRKVIIFFGTVLVLCTIIGSVMYIVEGPEYGYTSIPKSIYWTIVTVTTVGYGDITPHTTLGQMISAAAMLLGYSIIAIPTGILTAELAQELQRERDNTVCQNCNRGSHDRDSSFCRFCGVKLLGKYIS